MFHIDCRDFGVLLYLELSARSHLPDNKRVMHITYHQNRFHQIIFLPVSPNLNHEHQCWSIVNLSWLPLQHLKTERKRIGDMLSDQTRTKRDVLHNFWFSNRNFILVSPSVADLDAQAILAKAIQEGRLEQLEQVGVSTRLSILCTLLNVNHAFYLVTRERRLPDVMFEVCGIWDGFGHFCVWPPEIQILRGCKEKKDQNTKRQYGK